MRRIALHHKLGLITLFLVGLISYVGSQVVPVSFVDGGCQYDGNGTSGGTTPPTCATSPGGSGPYQTIGECIQNGGGSNSNQVISSGQKCEIRGAHDSEGANSNAFNGRYFESLFIGQSVNRPAGIPFGKGWNCTGGLGSCVIEGCRASVTGCPADEVPTISAMTTRNNWTAQAGIGGGVLYTRPMEASPNSWVGPTERGDDLDPEALYQVNGSAFRPLLYGGDTTIAPTDADAFPAGSWRYNTTTHEVYARLFNDANASTDLYVPHFGTAVWLESPSQNVRLQYVNVEGARTVDVNWCTSTSVSCPDTHLEHGWVRYTKLYANHIHSATNIFVNDWNCEIIGRGISLTGVSDGVFCFRDFNINGATFQDLQVQHVGADGATGNGGHHCPWCQSPWNHGDKDSPACTGPPGCTYVRSNGIAFQVKQTRNFTGRRLTGTDLSAGGYSEDVSTGSLVEDLTISQSGDCVTASNFTPTFPATGCTAGTTCDKRWWANFTLHRFTCIDTGSSTRIGAGTSTDTRCAINLAGDDLTQWGQYYSALGVTYLAHVSDGHILRPSYGGVCIGLTSVNQVSPPGGIDIENLTIAGTKTGIIGTPTSRGVVIAQASNATSAVCPACEHGITIRNVVTNTDLTNETMVIGGDASAFAGYTSPTALLSTNPPGILFDYSTLGNAGSIMRWGGTVPFLNNPPSGGTLDTLANFKTAFSLEFVHSSGQTDPLLVSATSPNLQSGSPARDAGVANTWFHDDLTAVARPQPNGGSWDQGATEYCSGTCDVTTSTTSSTTTSSTTTTAPGATTTTSTTNTTLAPPPSQCCPNDYCNCF